jgi:MFS transporter, SHS family, sialic acid transporter
VEGAAYNNFFLTMCLLAGLTTASFYGWLPLYLPELFPTRVRATGQGLAYNIGRIFAAGGALAQGQLTTFFGSIPRACGWITLIYLVGMAVIWFAPETKGKPLPE